MKHITGVPLYQLFFVSVVSILFTGMFLMIPASAFAAEITGQAVQILPQGGNSCATVSVGGFKPYIYGGSLDTFEFTVSDPSYTALVATVGNTSVPFNFMTRRVDSAGVLHILVSLNSTPVIGTLPIKITLLSAKGAGQPVCALVASASVGSGALQTITGSGSGGAGTSGGTPTGMTATSYGAYAKATPEAGPVATEEKPTVTTSPTPTASTSLLGTVAKTSESMKNLCASQSGAIGLWIILLALYAIIIAALLWASWPASWAWVRTAEWLTAGILTPLVILLAFWYAIASCRGTWWIPVAAFVIAIAGLFAAFWNHPRVQLLLAEQKKN